MDKAQDRKKSKSMLHVLQAQLTPELNWLVERRDNLDRDGKVDTAAILTRTIAELKMKVAVEAVRVDAMVMSRSALPPVIEEKTATVKPGKVAPVQDNESE